MKTYISNVFISLIIVLICLVITGLLALGKEMARPKENKVNIEEGNYLEQQRGKKFLRYTEFRIDSQTFVYVDNKTNVQYLRVIRNPGLKGGIDITPLYKKDGNLYLYSGGQIKSNRFIREQKDTYSELLMDRETGVEYLVVSKEEVRITPLLNNGKNYNSA